MFFKFNYRYYSYIFYKEDLDSCSKSKTIENLSSKFQN